MTLVEIEGPAPARTISSQRTAEALGRLRSALRHSRPLSPREWPELSETVSNGLGALVDLQRTRPGADDPVLFFRRRQVEARRRRFEQIAEAATDLSSAEQYFEALDSFQRSAERFLDALVQELEPSPSEVQAATRRWRRRLQEALLLRRHLADFRFLTGQAAKRNTADLQLRYAAMELARLLGSDARGLLRAHDERVLIDLQRRLKQWFHGDASGLDAGHLLVDLSGVGHILAEVNHREELLLRDSELARGLPRRAVDSQSLLVRVHELYGVSDVVDAALKQKQPIETNHLDLLRRAVGQEPASHS